MPLVATARLLPLIHQSPIPSARANITIHLVRSFSLTPRTARQSIPPATTPTSTSPPPPPPPATATTTARAIRSLSPSPTMAPRSLPCGMYAPTTTFFAPETEDLDIPAIQRHAVFLANAGLAGIVVMGSNGEAAHCTRDEKLAALRATREALDAAGFPSMPLVFGATEGSVRGTVELCRLASSAGADYAMVLPPSYYRPQVDEQMIHDYFVAVADASPLPLILYNYPGAVAGVDMHSDLVARISRHPNVVGTKFTCGSTGKLTRVAAACDAKRPGHEGSGYLAFGGMCDFTIQTLVSGGSGIIAGAANVVPRICVRVWNLWVEGKREEAERLQRLVSHADWVLSRNLVASTKQGLQSFYGYGGVGRKPLRAMDAAAVRLLEEELKEAMEVERSL